MNVIVKPASSEEEFRGKAFVHWKCWQETYRGMVDEQYLSALTLEKCEQIAFKWRENILVAKDGERVIGFAGYGKSTELPECGEVFALYVLPEYHGTGVGAQLFKAALDRLGNCPKKCLWVLRENKRAIRFYEKHGFRADGAEKLSPSIAAAGIRMISE